MSDVLAVSTSSSAASERPRLWASALARLCGRLDADTLGAPTLDGELFCASIGRLKLCDIEATRHRIALTPALARTEKHPVVKVVLQERGTSIYEQGGERVVVSPGDCLAYDVSCPHVVTSPGATKHMVVVVPKEIAERRGLARGRLSEQRFSSREGVGRIARDLVRSTLAQMPSLARACAGEGELADAILDLLALPLSRSSSRPQRSTVSPAEVLNQRVKRFIRDHLRDPDLSVERIASALHCTTRYLHMAFAREGTTISRYVWTSRLEACRRELDGGLASGATLTALAFSWGFSSSSHFSRAFKDHFGVSPSALQGRGGA
jgi:AraC family transcriptional regulator, positive regulator of tynA and feaB